MSSAGLVQVALDKELVNKLMNGLYNGAAGKALKVVISVDGSYHIESKELRLIIEVDKAKDGIQTVHINNEKQCAVISAQDIEEMNLTDLSKRVVAQLKEKYSPVFHSLADNIVVFGRAYGSN